MVDADAERSRAWFGGKFRPLSQALAPEDARALLGWDDVGLLLENDPEVEVVARGRVIHMPPPRSLVQLHWHLAAGVGVCVRRAEQTGDKLASLAALFSELGPAHIQIFATPGGSYRVGWHYDDADIFIAQIAGTEIYSYRANTITADQAPGPESFRRVSDEVSPLTTTTLTAGDFLYIPARWWHMASCHTTALSLEISVGHPSPEPGGTPMDWRAS